MEPLQRAILDLVIGNRILAYLGVFDEYGHVSVRHPRDPSLFLLARDCPGAFVEPGDIQPFTLDGNLAVEDNRRALRGTLRACRDLCGAAGRQIGGVRGLGRHAAVRYYRARDSTRCSAPSATWARGFRSGTSQKNSATRPTLTVSDLAARPRPCAAAGLACRGADPRRRLRGHRPHAQRRGALVGLHPEECARARDLAAVRTGASDLARRDAARGWRSTRKAMRCAAAGSTGRKRPAVSAGCE